MAKKFGGKGEKHYLCSVLFKWYTNTEVINSRNN